MKRLSASLLALGLAATSGLAAAQSYGYDDDHDRNQVQAAGTGYYDYARVLRVDPVMGSGGYGSNAAQRCYNESGSYEQGGGSYDQYNHMLVDLEAV